MGSPPTEGSVVVNQDQLIDARRILGRRLAAFRQAAGYGQEAFASLVHYSRSSLANVEIGRQKGTRDFWNRCDEILGTGGVLAASLAEIQALERRWREETAHSSQSHPMPDAEPSPVGTRGRVARAAHESQAFLAEWESRCLSPQTIEEFAEDLSRLSAEYVYEPLDGIFDELVAVRDRACGLLGQQRRTSDTRGLLFVAGLACGMLSHASIDLGDRRSAAHQARVAFRLATEAGHTGLVAWVCGTQSLIAYCLRLPEKAVEFAERGEAYARSTAGRVRLAALKARAQAARSNGPAARQALEHARVARESPDLRDDLDAMAGILGFPRAKQSYYAASTAALVSDGMAAENHARQAIYAYETGPEDERSYGDLALSRVYLAQSQLLKPAPHQDPAAASAALRGVLALPPEQRIAGLRRPLCQLQAELDREPIRHAAEARHLSAEIAEFLTGTPAVTST
jgi:DNA-binding XRE family transcriptional regulator